MRTLTRRLEKLEKTLAPLVVNKTDDAADLRASIRHSAKDIGQPLAAQFEELLDEIGPYQFQLELHRAYLLAHGFVQDPVRESLADTTCRAAGIRFEETKSKDVRRPVGHGLCVRANHAPRSSESVRRSAGIPSR